MIPAAAVEAAAEHFYMSGPGGTDIHWDDLPKQRKAYFRRRARAALESAAPHMLKSACDRGFEHGSTEPANPYRTPSAD